MNARDDTLDFPLSKCDNLEANAVRFEFDFQTFQYFFKPISRCQYQSERKKIVPPSVVCHGLQENAFQVNQFYNVTWSGEHSQSVPL